MQRIITRLHQLKNLQRMLPYRLQPKYSYNNQQARRSALAMAASALLGGLILTAAVLALNPAHDEQPTSRTANVTTTIMAEQLGRSSSQYSLTSQDLAWPSAGQSAIGVYGSGVIAESNPGANPVPMASLTKVVTALTLLEKSPLGDEESAPQIAITQADEAIYNDYVFRNGSVAPVKAGTSISLYDAIRAMIIRSANNLADTAVNSQFDSIETYLTVANKWLAEQNLSTITVADTTGFSPQSEATPADLVRLGELALDNPLIAEAGNTWEITLENIGTINNTNNFLDFEGNGVIGLKTGDTDEAGGTYLVAAKRVVAGEDVIIIAAILGGENHFSVQATAMPLIDDFTAKLQPLP